MKISTEKIEQIADLARLTFSSLEKEELIVELQKQLTSLDKLFSINVNGIVPLLQLNSPTQFMRKDEALPGLTPQEALSNTDNSSYPFFQVPKIISSE